MDAPSSWFFFSAARVYMGLALAWVHAMTYDWVRWPLDGGLGSDIPHFFLSAIGTRPKLHGISQTTTFRGF